LLGLTIIRSLTVAALIVCANVSLTYLAVEQVWSRLFAAVFTGKMPVPHAGDRFSTGSCGRGSVTPSAMPF